MTYTPQRGTSLHPLPTQAPDLIRQLQDPRWQQTPILMSGRRHGTKPQNKNPHTHEAEIKTMPGPA